MSTPREAVTFALQQMRLAAAEATPVFVAPTMPTVNLNGSDREALVQQQLAILSAMETLLEALQAGFPHGRDYQLAPATYEPARAEAEAGLLAVQHLRSRHRAIVRHLMEG